MKTIEVNGKEVNLKLMSLRDADMVIRDKARLIKTGISDEVSELVANILNGVEGGFFQITDDGILNLPIGESTKILEGINAYNSPLEEPSPVTEQDIGSSEE